MGSARLGPEPGARKPLRLALEAMGTRFELVLANPAHQGAGEMALERIAEEDARLSAFRNDSLVSLVNREGRKGPVALDAEFLELLDLCREVHEASDGAFDPMLGHRMAVLGFRGEATRDEDDPIQLDLGAVGKGWALDRAVEILKEEGVETALLHGGTSTVVALGHPPESPEGWGIRTVEWVDGEGETVFLRDAALSVSSCHGRTIKRDGKSIGHVLDPRTGEPVPGPRSALAVADSAALADAWATALLVLGEVPTHTPLHRARVSSPPREEKKP